MSFFIQRQLVIGLCAIVASSSVLRAEDGTPTKPLSAIRQVLADEFQREVNRREQLESLRTGNNPDSTIYWQSGFVKTQGQWFPAEDLGKSALPELLVEYRQRRDSQGAESAKAHMTLAKWCREKKLVDQERAHLYAALESDSKLLTKANLSRLGFVEDQQRYVSPEEQIEQKRYSSTVEHSLQKWGVKVERIRSRMAKGGAARTAALEELSTLRDPSVIAALDQNLAAHGGAYLRAAIGQLSEIPSFESTQLLAKYAIMSPDESIRSDAISAVKDRRRDDYMPQLIRMLVTDIQYHVEMRDSLSRNGVLLIGLRWGRETEARTERGFTGVRVVARITEVQRTGLPGRELRSLGDNAAQRRAESELYERATAIETANESTREFNQRIAGLLSAVTDRPADTNPHSWWHWWYKENNWKESEDRPVVEISEEPEFAGEMPFLLRQHSCFRKGTLVWTEQGRVPIESLRIGDLVVAQEPETGELALKPILRTSVNPDQHTTLVRFGDEELVATAAHQYWQAGEGWKRCRDVQASQFLHTGLGSQRITDVSTTPDAELVYNLVVADFHTYLVGESGVLVQDLFPPRPTNNIVPGLSKFEVSDSKPSASYD